MPHHHRYAVLNIDGETCRIQGYTPWHPERKRVEGFIAERFQLAHGAHVQHFMPLLVALEREDGTLLAIAGVRAANLEPLFLEHYLNAPIERVIEHWTQQQPPRHQIVEMGNLAAVKPGYSRYLFAAMSDLLMHWGYRWLACTAIANVINVFRRLGMDPLQVAEALPDKIPGGGAGWGDYYQKQPHVMFGNIEKGRLLTEKCGLLAHCGYNRLENAHALSA